MEKLWTYLPANGTWRLQHRKPGDATFTQKMLWWRKGYDWRAEPQPKLTVTGRRLDASAPPLTADHASNGFGRGDPNHAFMTVGFDIPTLGCWEITGHYEGQELTFIVWVAP